MGIARVNSVPETPKETLRAVQKYLEVADLRDTSVRMEIAVGVSYEVIRYRLRMCGTTWNDLKRAERVKRLHRMLDQGASQKDCCRALGFSLAALQQLFQREFGMSFTNYKKRVRNELSKA